VGRYAADCPVVAVLRDHPPANGVIVTPDSLARALRHVPDRHNATLDQMAAAILAALAAEGGPS
jgi:hypothetical protein